MVKDDLNKNPVTLGQFKQFQKGVNRRFDKVHEEITGLKIILNHHTKALLSIENTMKFYGDMYKANRDSNENLDKRVTALEMARV